MEWIKRAFSFACVCVCVPLKVIRFANRKSLNRLSVKRNWVLNMCNISLFRLKIIYSNWFLSANSIFVLYFDFQIWSMVFNLMVLIRWLEILVRWLRFILCIPISISAEMENTIKMDVVTPNRMLKSSHSKITTSNEIIDVKSSKWMQNHLVSDTEDDLSQKWPLN